MVQNLPTGRIWTFLFDVDGTLKSEDAGISADLLPVLAKLGERGHKLGLCSSQSTVEITEFVVDELGSTVGVDGLFNAGFILEDGHVWVPPDRIPVKAMQVLTSPEALAEMEVFRSAFQAAWRPATHASLREQGWGFVDSVPHLPVQLIPERYRVMGSVTVWEKGPEITLANYRGEYDDLMFWAQALATELSLRHVELAEVGNGTLRMLEIGVNKGSALKRIGFDLSRLVFVGNGLNDLPPSQVVCAGKGLVMTVANAIPELKQLAHRVSNQPASAGVVELLESLMGGTARNANHSVEQSLECCS